MTKKNILIVTRGLFIGGAELVIANICKNIDRDKFNILVCYLILDGPITNYLMERDIEVFPLYEEQEKRSKYFSFVKLIEIIKKKKIDLIHSHDTAALVESSLAKLILCRVKLVHTFHFGNYPHGDKTNYILEKIFWRSPDQLVSVGNEQKKRIAASFKIQPERILTILNGIEPKKPGSKTFPSTVNIENKVVIGSISTLITQKGISYLIAAADILRKSHDNFLVIIVGDGPLRQEIEEEIKKKHLEKYVCLLGWVEDAAANVLPMFDIFVQASLWEAMSMVILEAMACSKPIVATSVGENVHVIDDSKNGYLVAPKDADAMCRAIKSLLDDPERRKRFGLLAKQRAEQLFTADKMASSYQKLYHEILSCEKVIECNTGNTAQLN